MKLLTFFRSSSLFSRFASQLLVHCTSNNFIYYFPFFSRFILSSISRSSLAALICSILCRKPSSSFKSHNISPCISSLPALHRRLGASLAREPNELYKLCYKILSVGRGPSAFSVLRSTDRSLLCNSFRFQRRNAIIL